MNTPITSRVEDKLESHLRNTDNPPQARPRIIVMDDELELREVVTHILEAFKYEAIESSNGTQTLQIYTEASLSGNPIDLVIMDLNISDGMGGKECIQKLLELDRAAKAILASGYANDPVTTNFQAYGFRAVLPKPYGFEEIKRTVQEVLNKG